MPRGEKQKHSSEKTPLLNKTNDLMIWLFGKLCKEDVFPKRSRWLFAGKIADLANDYHSAIHKANEIRVVTQRERDLRHYYQTAAMSYLMALDSKVNLAQQALDIDPEKLHYYATLTNECRSLLIAWMNSDNKRYGPPTGLKNTEGSDR